MFLTKLRIKNKSCQFVLLATVLTVASSFSWSQPNTNSKVQLSLRDQVLYDLTFNSCETFSGDMNTLKSIQLALNPQGIDVFIGTFSDAMHATGKFFNGDKQALQVFTVNNGLGAYVNELLNSHGFILAMRDCFKDQPYKEHVYVMNLIMFDFAAKYINWAAPLQGSVRGLYWIKKHFASHWIKALFLGLASAPLTSSSSTTFQSLSEKMATQAQDISDQIDKLLKSKK